MNYLKEWLYALSIENEKMKSQVKAHSFEFTEEAFLLMYKLTDNLTISSDARYLGVDLFNR